MSGSKEARLWLLRGAEFSFGDQRREVHVEQLLNTCRARRSVGVWGVRGEEGWAALTRVHNPSYNPYGLGFWRQGSTSRLCGLISPSLGVLVGKRAVK